MKWVERKYIKQGSTFWNSGYVDFLDVNYQEVITNKTTERKYSEQGANDTDSLIKEVLGG